MMINNAKAYLSSKNPLDTEGLSVFDISASLAILTGKTKEDIALEISGVIPKPSIQSTPSHSDYKNQIIDSVNNLSSLIAEMDEQYPEVDDSDFYGPLRHIEFELMDFSRQNG